MAAIGKTLRLLNALNSEDRGLKVRLCTSLIDARPGQVLLAAFRRL